VDRRLRNTNRDAFERGIAKPTTQGKIERFFHTLKSEYEAVTPLAKLVFQKTNGNPFFVNQFLSTLHNERLLFFDSDERRWKWEISKILSLDIENAEQQYGLEAIHQLTAEKIFERSWAMTVLNRTMTALQAEFAGKNKQKLFENPQIFLVRSPCYASHFLPPLLDIKGPMSIAWKI
jgi:hypothetical protein